MLVIARSETTIYSDMPFSTLSPISAVYVSKEFCAIHKSLNFDIYNLPGLFQHGKYFHTNQQNTLSL